MNSNRSGFTLLELMVAMGILAILVGLSIVGIQTVQRSLRNTQRNEVMSAVNLKIQDIFTTYGTYPTIRFEKTGIYVDENLDGIVEESELYYELEGIIEGSSRSSNGGTAYCYEVYNRTTNDYSLGVELEGGGWQQFGTSSQGCTAGDISSSNEGPFPF